MKKLNVIGIMSGTSLDGLDVVAAQFSHNNRWEYKILHAQTFEYGKELKNELQNLDSVSALQYETTNHQLGRVFGERINQFIKETNFKPDFIASHGHTVFHQPENYLTTQIGHPAAIKAVTGIPVVADFRTTDVHMGGQGAPLVPIGDLLLFSEYSHCLNLGGMANISIKENEKITAFDICAANMALNYLAKKNGKEYDENGEMAASGIILPRLLDEILKLDFHSKKPPKSLGKEWFDGSLKPILDLSLESESINDVMATVSESIATLISKHLNPESKVLITGGGAFNTHLMTRIKHASGTSIENSNTELINYKEALIFGFLGVLRWIHEPNILCTVTGVEMNHIGGCVYV